MHARPARGTSPSLACALVLALLVATGVVGAPAHATSPRTADRHGAVAAEHPRAAEIGAEILRRGGNAVDAAIATAYAVCVLNASSCGLGGGGFMLIHEANGAVHALDYRETAPALAHRGLYRLGDTVLSDLSRRGGLAVAVPGEVAGLEAARVRFARLSRAALLAPAIALARDGFPIGAHLASEIAGNAGMLATTPALAHLFLHDDGSPRQAGELVRYPALATTLERVAANGADAFYRGPVAAALVHAVDAAGGILTARDLAEYRPRWRAPLRTTYRGLAVFTMPPPSSGGVLLEMLNVLARDDLAALGARSPAYLHLLAETMKTGFADRARWYGDPAFTTVPIARLTSAAYGRELRARIRPDAVLPLTEYGSAPDHGTTHLSVADGDGMAVACTTTINTGFGAMLMDGESGVILNNEMDDFAIAPGVPNAFGLIGSEANAVGAGKRPLSSMTPVIARSTATVHPGAMPRRLVIAGGSGGPLIIGGTLQALLGMIDFGRDAAGAVSAPRIHDQWAPPALAVEAGIDEPTRAELARRGHEVRLLTFAGAVEVVTYGDGRFDAAADPRKGGGAVTR
ncbi:MAG: gamma-glutamyltransferase [Deltaproteobacteria bacterium]|nr:gamma-glutamyltransferase [Deltaproteobacteria bacterium]